MKNHIEPLEKLYRKPHVQKIIEKAKAEGKVVGNPGSTRSESSQIDRNLPDYDKQRSKNDLFSSGRVVSGGGPGTGKKR